MRTVSGTLEKQLRKLTTVGKERRVMAFVKAAFVERNNVVAGKPISCTNSTDSQSSDFQAGERVGVAVRPLLDSQRLATPGVSRDLGILSAKSR